MCLAGKRAVSLGMRSWAGIDGSAVCAGQNSHSRAGALLQLSQVRECCQLRKLSRETTVELVPFEAPAACLAGK